MGRGEATVDEDLLALEREPSAVGHGIPRVDQDVEEDLIELTRVTLDHRKALPLDEVDVDGRGENAPHHLEELANLVIHVERPDRQRLRAAHRQQLSRQVGGAARGRHDRVDLRAERRVVELFDDDAGARADHGQEIVEVVGDTPGEHAQALELLDLEEPPLEVQTRFLGLRRHLQEPNAAGGDGDLAGHADEVFQL